VARIIHGGAINGPWDMTALDSGNKASLFVTNVLNGTVAAQGAVVNRGTVVRVDLVIRGSKAPSVQAETVIGSGFGERTDPAALVIGPTGVALTANGTLYVADTLENRIAAIRDAVHRHNSALSGTDVSANGALRGPLGLVTTPQQHLIAMNGGNGNAVEITTGGAQVAIKTLDTSGSPPGSGALFGAAITPDGKGLYFVDDATNTLQLLH
jgi:DNA-binding beta-propeller fold protein YncE